MKQRYENNQVLDGYFDLLILYFRSVYIDMNMDHARDVDYHTIILW